jgi:hypothetical protein
MKKILTIAATAGLLSTFAASVQAQTTGTATLNATVASSCNVTIPTATTTFTQVGTPPTSLTGTTSAQVTCNDTSKKLTLTQNNSTSLPSGTATFNFAGGTGIFQEVTGVDSGLFSDTTPSTGDTASISASVSRTDEKLLKSGSYSLVINATVVP